MKYEEWIRYEEARQSQPQELALMAWIEYPIKDLPPYLISPSKIKQDNPDPTLWSLIVQYLNTRKI